jgi:CRISPR-associated protein Cmr3
MNKNKPKNDVKFSNNYKKQAPKADLQKADGTNQNSHVDKNNGSSEVGPCWCFSALDTWFFRESRPMESVGGAQLSSVFPPPARTVIGAIRTAIGQAHGVDWHNYPHGQQAGHQALRELMGDADGLGCLSFSGPFVIRSGQRLYPAPLVVLQAKQPDKKDTAAFTRLVPSDGLTDCDLGRVQLPKKLNAAAQGAKPLEQTWLTAKGLRAVLAGQTPTADDVIEAKDLFHAEERLGIGRDNATRTTQDGLLYQTQHVRPAPDVELGMQVQGLETDQTVPAQGLMRLGAEGRMAHWSRSNGHMLLDSPAKGSRLLLVLMTHGRFTQGWLPDGFEVRKLPTSGQTVWEGTLRGVTLRLLCAVVGKPVREGGWDLALRAPRSMESLTPAGSSYFCEVLNVDATAAPGGAVQALHGSHMGQDTALGRGEMAVGTW